MKKLFVLLLVLFIIPSVLADITIQTNQPIYNLGNKIHSSVSIQKGNFEGLFKLEVECSSYNLQYFTTPISLEEGFTTAVDIPDFTVNPAMLGPCKLNSYIVTNDGNVEEQKSSTSFFVTSELKILPINSHITALPSESVQFTGVVNDAFDTNILSANVEIKIEDIVKETEVIDGKYTIGIIIPQNIKSGSHDVTITAKDPKNNIGTATTKLDITAIPTQIETKVSEISIIPGQQVTINSTLLDQAKDPINEILDIGLTSPKGENVFFKTANSGIGLDYEFSQYAEPGIYTITSSYKDIISKSEVIVGVIKEVKVRYENQTVHVENIGNLLFSEEITFILEKGLDKIPITKKLDILPGKFMSIDLSKEVPGGIYDIAMPIKEGISTFKDNIQYVFSGQGDMEEKNIIAEGVEIEDNRPIYKKLGTGLSSMTGFVTGADGFMTRNPLIAPLALISIVLFFVVKYARKPIMRLIRKGKEKEDIDMSKINIEEKEG